jgi:hypothetical protein
LRVSAAFFLNIRFCISQNILHHNSNMKSILAIVVSCWSVLTLTSCIDLAPLQGGGGYSGGGGGYGGGSGYTRPGYNQNQYSQPHYNNNSGGYRPAPQYDSHDHNHNSHSGSSSSNKYFGGPESWYKSGYALGKRDRREHKSCNYRRYSNQYDGKTQAQFARGYDEGYH